MPRHRRWDWGKQTDIGLLGWNLKWKIIIESRKKEWTHEDIYTDDSDFWERSRWELMMDISGILWKWRVLSQEQVNFSICLKIP
jgi:hypothetical protein